MWYIWCSLPSFIKTFLLIVLFHIILLKKEIMNYVIAGLSLALILQMCFGRCDGRPVQLREPAKQTPLSDDRQGDARHRQWEQGCESRLVILFVFKHQRVFFFLFNNILSYLLQRLNSAIIYDRDFSYNFFGFKVIFKICIQDLNPFLCLDLTFPFRSNRLLSAHTCWRLMAKVKHD